MTAIYIITTQNLSSQQCFMLVEADKNIDNHMLFNEIYEKNIPEEMNDKNIYVAAKINITSSVADIWKELQECKYYLENSVLPFHQYQSEYSYTWINANLHEIIKKLEGDDKYTLLEEKINNIEGIIIEIKKVLYRLESAL